MSVSDTGWQPHISSYLSHLRFEKNLADNTVEAYGRDIGQFREFLRENFPGVTGPADVGREHVENYLAWLYDRRVRPATQSRVLCGIRSFFSYLVLTDILPESPAQFIDMPRQGRKLPEVLSIEEIDAILAAIDLGHPQGHRNKAIIETLYSCGLRVSELTGLRLGDLFFDDGFIRVTGKGDKQRLVPLSDAARRNISLWLDQRRTMTPDGKYADTVFLNRRGRALTRVMVYTIVQRAADAAGVGKKISPHTFRHSFATHLLQGGASIRQVQDLLGHESILTTEIYTHLDTAALHRSMEDFHPLSHLKK